MVQPGDEGLEGGGVGHLGRAVGERGEVGVIAARIAAAACDDHLGACRGERTGHAEPDAGAAARHEHPGPREVEARRSHPAHPSRRRSRPASLAGAGPGLASRDARARPRYAALRHALPSLRVGSGRATAGALRERRRPAARREAPAADRRVRLHRRGRRGRAHARRERPCLRPAGLPAEDPARRRTHDHRDDDPRTPGDHASRPRTDRLRPDRALAGRARGGPRGGTRRHSLQPVDARHPLDRRGRGRLQRTEVVPGLRLEGSRARQADGGAFGRRRLRGAAADGRHGGPRTSRARRAQTASRFRRSSGPTRSSTASSTPAGPSTS